MLNRAVLMGRLTRDPELRHTASSVPVTTFTLAVDRDYTRQGEQKQTDFLDVVAWRQTAEFVSRYFRKGQLVAVSGSIQTRHWEDKNGAKRVSVEIIADSVYFAEPRRDAAERPAFEAGPSDFDAPEQKSDFQAFSEEEDGDLPF